MKSSPRKIASSPFLGRSYAPLVDRESGSRYEEGKQGTRQIGAAFLLL